MKKWMVLGVMLVLLVIAIPAMAADHNGRFGSDRFDGGFRNFFDRFPRGHSGFNNTGGVSQQIGQQAQSGDVSMSFSVGSKGDNNNQCVTPQQFANTGSLQNGQGVLQNNSIANNIEPSGSSFVFTPSLSAKCTQSVQQSAAASG